MVVRNQWLKEAPGFRDEIFKLYFTTFNNSTAFIYVTSRNASIPAGYTWTGVLRIYLFRRIF